MVLSLGNRELKMPVHRDTPALDVFSTELDSELLCKENNHQNVVEKTEMVSNNELSMKGNRQMGFLKCSKCGRKVSTTDSKCPHCGVSSDNLRTAAAGLETLVTLGHIIQDDKDVSVNTKGHRGNDNGQD